MTPARTGSEISKLIKKLVRSESLPKPWTATDLIGLIKEYRCLVSSITQKETDASTERRPGGGITKAEVEEWLTRNGTPGAYESMHKTASESG